MPWLSEVGRTDILQGGSRESREPRTHALSNSTIVRYTTVGFIAHIPGLIVARNSARRDDVSRSGGARSGAR